MKNKVIKYLLCGTAILNLSACSVLDQWLPSFSSETQTSEQQPLEMPSVLPIPQDYPGVFNVYQRIRVEADQQFTQNQPSEFEAMIAANRKGMKIALMAMGMKVWSIDYDGMVITEERGEQVPDALQAQYLMRDIALVYWPSASLKTQLDTGGKWQLSADFCTGLCHARCDCHLSKRHPSSERPRQCHA